VLGEREGEGGRQDFRSEEREGKKSFYSTVNNRVLLFQKL
jgi:hypothetical protein